MEKLAPGVQNRHRIPNADDTTVEGVEIAFDKQNCFG